MLKVAFILCFVILTCSAASKLPEDPNVQAEHFLRGDAAKPSSQKAEQKAVAPSSKGRQKPLVALLKDSANVYLEYSSKAKAIVVNPQDKEHNSSHRLYLSTLTGQVMIKRVQGEENSSLPIDFDPTLKKFVVSQGDHGKMFLLYRDATKRFVITYSPLERVSHYIYYDPSSEKYELQRYDRY